MISCPAGQKRRKSLTINRQRTARARKSCGHVGRLATILATDSLAIINANLRLQAGIRQDSIER